LPIFNDLLIASAPICGVKFVADEKNQRLSTLAVHQHLNQFLEDSALKPGALRCRALRFLKSYSAAAWLKGWHFATPMSALGHQRTNRSGLNFGLLSFE
jgi:hypothetical protein